jgi:hypothetical protein
MPSQLVISLSAIGVLWLAACDCGTAPAACRSSSQCPRGQSCIDSRCVDIPAGTDAGREPDAYEPLPGCIDADRDGRGEGCAGGPDCDDTDAARGGAEVCDTVDNDCNGMTDEGFAICSECTPACTIDPTVPGPGGWMPTAENSDGVIVDDEGALTLGRTMAESFAV